MSLFGISAAKILPALVLAGVLSIGVSAFAASNTFATANNAAGQAAQTVSGFSLTKPAYTLDTSVAGGVITTATFDATGSQPVTQASVKLVSANAAYHTCTPGTVTGTGPYTTRIVCSALGEAIAAVNTFDAVLVQ